MREPKWTKEEIEILKEQYPWQSISKISEKLGRSEATIRNRAYQIKVKRLPTALQIRKQEEYK